MVNKLGIIIPVYNEAKNIIRTLNAIDDNIRIPNRVYLIYDFDADNTLPVAREYDKSKEKLIFLKNSTGGVVNAIKKGLREAEEEYLLVTMADLSDDYKVVDSMCKLMDRGYDIMCGSRYMKGGKQIGGPLIKKTISRLVGLSLRMLAGIPTHDATNSFKIYRKGLLKTIEFESKGGFEIGMEIVVKAHFSRFKVGEIPCVWTDRRAGKSRFKVLKWGPKYLKWYLYAIRKKIFKK